VADAEIGSDERAERGAQNQSLFRAINERISDRGWDVSDAAMAQDVSVAQWVCECANVACFERIALSGLDYEHVRAVGWRFAVVPGELHVFPDIEELAERHDAFWIVEKSGAARQISIDLCRRGAIE
jgi:hypothetical protein